MLESMREDFGSIHPVAGRENPIEARTLEELESSYKNDSLFLLKDSLSEAQIKRHNEKLLELLPETWIIPEGAKLTGLSLSQAKQLYDRMMKNPIRRNESKYDRAECTVGFCFGRATIAHMEALLGKVHPAAIKKVWVVGDMGFWGHHVATIVRAKNGRDWYVIDNYTGFKTLKEWMNIMSKKSKKGPLMFSVTDAARFGPFNGKKYDPIDLFGGSNGDYYNGYFKDLFNYFHENKTPRPLSEF